MLSLPLSILLFEKSTQERLWGVTLSEHLHAGLLHWDLEPLRHCLTHENPLGERGHPRRRC